MSTAKRLLRFSCVFFGMLSWAQAAPITPAQTDIIVNATSYRLNGSVDANFTREPLWFEVRASNGTLLDYGAFAAVSAWSLQARHLVFGKNVVTIYGRGNDGTIAQASVSLTLDKVAAPAVRPRPKPAEIWWGRFYTDDLLGLQDASTWRFVQAYQDAFFIHSYGNWASSGNSGALLRSLANTMRPYQGRFATELPAETQPDSGWPARQLSLGNFIRDVESTGAVLTELGHNFQLSAQQFCDAYPSFSEQGIVDAVVAQWRQVLQGYASQFPHSKFSITQSPVWWPWNGYPALGDRNTLDIFAGGKTFHLNMAAFMGGMEQATRAAGYATFGFASDVPYYALNWGNPSEAASIQQKILAYEAWLQARGGQHTLLCMGPDASLPPNSDAWDANYSQQSLQEVTLWQSLGGRADRYNFESFYMEGPRVTVPETQAHSFTNTIAQAIKYLKGIRDTQGNLETLRLQGGGQGLQRQVLLTNTGDVTCMPTLLVPDAAAPAAQFYYLGTNVTQAIRSAEGWTLTSQLAPGASIVLQIVATADMQGLVPIEAFWNPQDPTGIVRARKILAFGTTPATPMAKPTKLVNPASGQCIDLANNLPGDGTAIRMWPCNGYDAQRFVAQTDPSGNMQLLTFGARKCLDVTGNSGGDEVGLQQWTCNGNAGQTFRFNKLHDNLYTLAIPRNNKCVDVRGGGSQPGTAVQQLGCNGGATQVWAPLESVLDERRARPIVNVGTAKCIDLPVGSFLNGTYLQQYTCNGLSPQQWLPVLMGVDIYGVAWYALQNSGTSKCIEVESNSKANGARLWQWDCGGPTRFNQHFAFIPQGEQIYQLIVRHSGQTVDLFNGSDANGAWVRQWPANLSSAQMWSLY